MSPFSFFKKHLDSKGFTLLETLVSIAMLALVIVGPLAVIVNASSYARQTKDVIVSTYLAEEAVELLQNQYDSMYIFCTKQINSSDPLCNSPNGNTPGKIVWEKFKDRFSSTTSLLQSCGKLDELHGGCAYDYIDMTSGTPTTTPTLYPNPMHPTSGPCPTLIGVTTIGTLQYSYVCSGVSSHLAGTIVDNKTFVRSVVVEDLINSADPYGGDLRVTVTVQFRGVNGRAHTMNIIRFMHMR